MSFLDTIHINISETLKWHNIIIFLLIGIVAVILLFCFGPWISSSSKSTNNPTNKIKWLDTTNPSSPANHITPSNITINQLKASRGSGAGERKEGFTTQEQSLLLKALGFSKLGETDAKYNILNVKTRSVMNPDNDIQVLDVFTSDISLLQKINSGSPVSFVPNTGASNTATPASTPPTSVSKALLVAAFQKAVNQQLYYNTEVNKYLPSDYLEFMDTLLNKLYLLNSSKAASKTWSDADIVNVKAGLLTELNALSSNAATGWRKALYDNRQAIVSAIPTSIDNAGRLDFPSGDYQTSYSNYNTSIIWKLGLDTEIATQFAAKLYTVNASKAVTATVLQTTLQIGTDTTDYISLRQFMYYLNGLLDIAAGKISVASDDANKTTLTTTITDQQTYVTSKLPDYAGVTTTAPLTAPIKTIKGTTSTQPTAFVESLFAGVKVVIFNIISDSLIPKVPAEPIAANPNAEITYTKSETLALQAIGSKNYNPATGERNSRATDFYLDFTNGLDIQVKFMYNYNINIDNEVACEAVLREIPNNSTSSTAANSSNFKTYTFDKCLVDIDATGRKMLLKLNKVTDGLDYAKLVDDSVEPAGKYNKVTVYQEFVVEVNFAKSITELVGNSGSESFNLLINAATLANSFVTYKLSTKLKPEQASPYTVYQLLLFPRAITADFDSLNEFTKASIRKTTETLLNDNVAEIITPMYMVDKQLDKAERVISKIKDYYKFNQLSNTQTRYQFYPVAQ